MAVTLDPQLAATQDSLTRHPLCEVLSGQFTSAIPFDGEYFNDDTEDETEPAMFCHSTGRLCMIYSRESDGGEDKNLLYYNYTNTGRSQWNNELIYDAGATVEVWGKSLVEFSNGNIGVVFIEKASTNRILKYMIISVTGTVLTSPQTIETFAIADEWVANPHVMLRDSGSFYMTYAHEEITGSGEVANIMNRKSSDFADWGLSGEPLSIAGLDPTRRRNHPFVIEPGTGNMVLAFDYQDLVSGEQEVVNIYKTESADDGVSWGTASGETVYATYGYSARKPVLDEDSSNQLKLAYYNEIQVLHADTSTFGWCYHGTWCPGAPRDIHYQDATGLLYSVNGHAFTGNKGTCSVVVMDVDSWTVEKCYSDNTTPAYSSVFAEEHCWYHRSTGDGYYIPIATCNAAATLKAIAVINHETETIKEYYFCDNVTYSLTKNIDVDWRSLGDDQAGLAACWVDADTDRLYCYFIRSYFWDNRHWFGYIDLTETADPVTGKYSWTEIFYEALGSGIDVQGMLSLFNSMVIVPEVDYAIFAFGGDVSNWKGALWIYSLSSGSQIKDYNIDDYSGFHYRGAIFPVYYDGAVYYSFDYESLYGQQDRRGLGKIDIGTDTMSYIVPTYDAGIDDYKLWRKKSMGDGRLLISTWGYGIQTYHTTTQEWVEFSNDTLPGFTPDEVDDLGVSDVAYDATNQTIFGTKNKEYDDWNGLLAFSELGAWKRTVYRTGTWTSKWNFDAEANLTLYTLDWDGSIAIDEQDTMWMVWTRLDSDEYSNKWDKSDADFDLSNYLTDSVEVEWNIEQPNGLRFSCSDGHLFDPNNQMSILAGVCKRGRKITVRFGELSGETEYWQNQGTYVVQEAQLTYKRGQYPKIDVGCEDITKMWTEGTHPATEYFDGDYPEAVLENLLQDFANLSSGEYLVPSQGSMTGSHTLYHQWLDTSLMEMLQDVLDHFGYISNINVDGQWTMKEVDFDAPVDHSYPDNTKIVEYSPDDSYSNYINRIIVKGETRTKMEVLYAEENVTSISGTMGWWGCEETKTVYYSDDHSRTCRNPRLVIVEPPNINLFFTKKGGGSVEITDEDLFETYVEVHVEAPNLIWVCVAAIAAIVATGVAAKSCDASSGGGLWGSAISTITGTNCGAYIFMLSLEIQTLAYILGAIANYYVQIWAQPVGHEPQTFQAQADDTELQNELNGLIITEEIDDPFCYNYATAYAVAQREMDIVMAQRKRGRFVKLGHLQDEITDIIQIIHPYSGNALKFMITNLRRVYTKPDSPGDAGSFLDYIEGWRITS